MADVTDTFYAGSGWIGYGAQLLVGQDDGSPETFTAVPDISTITPGDMTTGVVPRTHLRSIGRHHEKIGTIRDSGEIAFAGFYVPTHGAHKQAGGDGFSATHNLLSLWRNVTECNFKIVLPDAAGDAVAGSPVTAIEIPIRGVVTRYQIGEIALETPTAFTLGITPLVDYSGDLP